ETAMPLPSSEAMVPAMSSVVSKRRLTLPMMASLRRSGERRVGKESRSLCDWSSDVCSSDLGDRNAVAFERGDGAGDVFGGFKAAAHAADDGKLAQIGRAACRERVEITV